MRERDKVDKGKSEREPRRLGKRERESDGEIDKEDARER